MKKIPALLFGFCILALAACQKSETNTDCTLVPVKLLRSDCDRLIFQSLSDKIKGDARWTDVQTGKTYQNVIADFNTCRLGALLNNQATGILYVDPAKIEYGNTSQPAGCVQCTAVSSNPPAISVRLNFVQTDSCGTFFIQ
jgi:hypothetical protein